MTQGIWRPALGRRPHLPGCWRAALLCRTLWARLFENRTHPNVLGEGKRADSAPRWRSGLRFWAGRGTSSVARFAFLYFIWGLQLLEGTTAGSFWRLIFGVGRGS